MTTYTIRINIKGLRESIVAKLVEKLKVELSPEQPTLAQISFVREPEPPTSRSERLEAALSTFSTAKDDAQAEVEALRDELQEWLDNLPENLQSGTKADEIQEAIDALESMDFDSIEVLDASDVNFPGMY